MIGVIIGCINYSWNIEEYELTNESDGEEVNLARMIQFTTPTQMHYDKCQYLETSFWFEVMTDDSTVKASATLKEID